MVPGTSNSTCFGFAVPDPGRDTYHVKRGPCCVRQLPPRDTNPAGATTRHSRVIMVARLAVLVASFDPFAYAWDLPPCNFGPDGCGFRRRDAACVRGDAATAVPAGRACTRAQGVPYWGRRRATLAVGLLRAVRADAPRAAGGVQGSIQLHCRQLTGGLNARRWPRGCAPRRCTRLHQPPSPASRR